jgi:hypothetical protein
MMSRMARWLLGVAMMTAVCGSASAATTELPIRSVSTSFSEEEGGFASYTYYWSGWMLFAGHKSCCGYRPPLADGWYRVDAKQAQAMFDAAAQELALGHTTDTVERTNEATIELEDGRRLELRGLVDAPTEVAHGPLVKKKPADWNKRRYLGRHESNLSVLRVMAGDPAPAAEPVSIDALLELARSQRGSDQFASRRHRGRIKRYLVERITTARDAATINAAGAAVDVWKGEPDEAELRAALGRRRDDADAAVRAAARRALGE